LISRSCCCKKKQLGIARQSIRYIHQNVIRTQKQTKEFGTTAPVRGGQSYDGFAYCYTFVLCRYGSAEYITEDYRPLITATLQALQQSLDTLEGKKKDKDLIIKTDPEQIRLLSQRINALVSQRQEELKQGQLETSTRKTLSDFKSITDQFYFIYKIGCTVDVPEYHPKT
jgi:hypothetical protein